MKIGFVARELSGKPMEDCDRIRSVAIKFEQSIGDVFNNYEWVFSKQFADSLAAAIVNTGFVDSVNIEPGYLYLGIRVHTITDSNNFGDLMLIPKKLEVSPNIMKGYMKNE